MAQKTKVNALMVEHKCSRTKANNMLRKRGNGNGNTITIDGVSHKCKRRSIPKV